eukprot:s1087_g16.t1
MPTPPVAMHCQRQIRSSKMCGESERPLETADSDVEGSLFGSQVEAYAQEANLSDEDFGEVLSPFGPETFRSAAECWAHAETAHGFSLHELRRTVGADVWSDYHRIRLVNHFRLKSWLSTINSNQAESI